MENSRHEDKAMNFKVSFLTVWRDYGLECMLEKIYSF